MSDLPPPPVLGFFEDADPEDAWAASDSAAEHLENLIRRVAFVIDHPKLSDGERLRRLASVREDILMVQNQVARATIALFGPDSMLDGRVREVIRGME